MSGAQLYDVVRMHGTEVEPGVFQDETVLRGATMDDAVLRARSEVRAAAGETFYVARSGSEGPSDIVAYVYTSDAGGLVVEEVGEAPPPRHPPGSLRMMSTGQAAEYLGVSRGTIRRWADTGLLPCFRTPGGVRRILRTDLDNVITKEGDT